MIGLIVPSARNFFFATIIDRVEYYVCQNGYKLLLCVSDLDLKKEVEYFNMLKSNKVAGVILASHTQNLLEHVSFQAPIITIDRTISQEIPSVCADNYSGGRLAAEHLLTKGCRRLAYISGSADIVMDANKRFIGFRDVCLERGAKPPLMIDASERSFISMQYRPLIQEMFPPIRISMGYFRPTISLLHSFCSIAAKAASECRNSSRWSDMMMWTLLR